MDEFAKSGVAIPDGTRDCVDLTPYAFQARYPGDYEPVTEEDFRRAIAQAGTVLDWAARIIERNVESKTD